MGSPKTEFCELCGQRATWYMFCEPCRRMRDAVGMVPHVCDQCGAIRMRWGPEDIGCGECPDGVCQYWPPVNLDPNEYDPVFQF